MYLARVSFQALRKRFAFWLHPWLPLRAGQPDDFRVRFDGRELEYEDHLGKLTFGLDWAPGTCAVLSHCGALTLELAGGAQRAALGARHDLAARRAREFLEWGGFQVRIFDPASGRKEATHLHEEWRFEKNALLENA